MSQRHASHRAWIDSLHQALAATRCRIGVRESGLEEASIAVGDLLLRAKVEDKAVHWVGNGGSAALCAHLAQDVLHKLAVRSLVLGDAPVLTCMANDYGYTEVYAKPLRTLMRPGDVLIAVSSSGKSANILQAAKLASEVGASLVTLTAFAADNPLWLHPSQVAFHLPTQNYGHAEVGHEALLHAVIDLVQQR